MSDTNKPLDLLDVLNSIEQGELTAKAANEVLEPLLQELDESREALDGWRLMARKNIRKADAIEAILDRWDKRAEGLRAGIPRDPTDRDDFKLLVASDVLKFCSQIIRMELRPALKLPRNAPAHHPDDLPWWSRRERHA